MSTPHQPPVASASQTVGPFFAVGPCLGADLGQMATSGTPGEPVALRVRVLDGDGTPVSDAMIEVWQADSTGAYAPAPDGTTATARAFTGFGRLGTDEDGWCTFATIRPGAVADTAHDPQAPHLNVCVFARGLLRHLYTRIYFEGDAALDRDPVLALVPAERRSTLLARRTGEAATWEFVVRLQGGEETVFFDL